MTSRKRDLSSALFNNDKLADIVEALEAHGGTPTAQEIARAIGVNNDLVKAVLVRLEKAGFVKPLPRVGSSSRAALPHEIQRGPEWMALLALCRLLA